jgi:hypothetical protein
LHQSAWRNIAEDGNLHETRQDTTATLCSEYNHLTGFIATVTAPQVGLQVLAYLIFSYVTPGFAILFS